MRAPTRLFSYGILLGISAILLVMLLATVLLNLRQRDYARLRSESAARVRDLQRQVEVAVGTVENEIATELAGFHLEGLRLQLARWTAGSETVIASFTWTPGNENPLWLSSDEWESHLRWEGDWLWSPKAPPAFAYSLDPETSEATYLGENLQILAYEGFDTAPAISWWIPPTQRSTAWVCWHRLAPDGPVRGCIVDPQPILTALLTAMATDPAGAARLLPPGDPGSPDVFCASTVFSPDVAAGHLLAGWQLEFLPAGAGTLQRYHRTLWLGAAAVGLLFLLGVALLVVQARREAADARRRVTFVSQVSHELRTPLTSIRMFAEMLGRERAPPEEKRRRFADTISRESERLGELIERLLTFQALERGTGRTVLRSVPVPPLVEETIEAMRTVIEEAGIEVQTDFPIDLPLAWTDPDALRQALLNLLGNAVKYAPHSTLRVGAKSLPPRLHLTVTDTGPGIAPPLRRHVFEPFVQGERELDTKPQGLGLGLSISRGLIRATGGELRLLPSNTGTTFLIELPLPPAS